MELKAGIEGLVKDGKVINIKFNFAPYILAYFDEGAADYSMLSQPGSFMLELNDKLINKAKVKSEDLILVLDIAQPFLFFHLDKHKKRLIAGENRLLFRYIPDVAENSYTYELRAMYVCDKEFEKINVDGKIKKSNIIDQTWKAEFHKGELELIVKFQHSDKKKLGIFS